MIEHYLNFREMFSPFAWPRPRFQISFMSFSRERSPLQKKKNSLNISRISCARMVLKYLQSLPAHVLRLMSHCFFPLKLYRLLLYTNHCQTIPMCTSCVFPAVNTITETNWIQSHTNFQVNISDFCHSLRAEGCFNIFFLEFITAWLRPIWEIVLYW